MFAGASRPHVVDFQCLLKNVMSLMTEDREQQLFFELELVHWDIVLINETWRPLKEEIWTSSGHLFLGAGGTAHSSGVAILLHKRWVRGSKGFKRASERLCALDLNIVKRKLRFIVPYMPTAWHADALVKGMYTELSKLCGEANRLQRAILVAGDFNAMVGKRSIDDPLNLIGEHGFGDRNNRGQQLVDWVSTEGLTITNTIFRKPVEKQWTHLLFGRERIIDYYLVEKRRWLVVKNVEATHDINIGTDHRCVRQDLQIETASHQKRPRRLAAKRSLRGWATADPEVYKDNLDAVLNIAISDDNLLIQALEEKCQLIETVLIEAGRKELMLEVDTSTVGGARRHSIFA